MYGRKLRGKGGKGPPAQAIDDVLARVLPSIWAKRRRLSRNISPLARASSAQSHQHHQHHHSSTESGPSASSDAQQSNDGRGVSHPNGPYVLGLSGLQGSGKTTWAEALAEGLRRSSPPSWDPNAVRDVAAGGGGRGSDHPGDHGGRAREELSLPPPPPPLNVVVLSLDDLYHDHEHLVAAREADPSNMLLRTRGHPGTHDEALAARFFAALADGKRGESVAVPAFDKGACGGEGDRVPEQEWARARLPVDVLVFEGWCVGFRALGDAELEARWEEAVCRRRRRRRRRRQRRPPDDDGEEEEEDEDEENDKFAVQTLARHDLAHLRRVNGNLRRYNASFLAPVAFDYLVHLDTDALANVYRWRLDQERALRAERGAGMADRQVVEFVRGYMPAYELYLDRLRREAFPAGQGEVAGHSRQLRVLLADDRSVLNMTEV